MMHREFIVGLENIVADIRILWTSSNSDALSEGCIFGVSPGICVYMDV